MGQFIQSPEGKKFYISEKGKAKLFIFPKSFSFYYPLLIIAAVVSTIFFWSDIQGFFTMGSKGSSKMNLIIWACLVFGAFTSIAGWFGHAEVAVHKNRIAWYTKLWMFEVFKVEVKYKDMDGCELSPENELKVFSKSLTHGHFEIESDGEGLWLHEVLNEASENSLPGMLS
ncbi:MAG: hypothetical protein NE334_15450 [Lentisphaeraceae bacterium]|nr:hypothetical protein [Lentisphaeraceae bacterium]